MMDHKKVFEHEMKSSAKKEKFWQKKWFKIVGVLVVVFGFIGGVVVWKTGSLLGRISTNANIFGSLGRMIPGAESQLTGEKEGRINMLLLGMRGSDDPAGGNLADSIMIASLNLDPKNPKISLISIPRDLYVKDIQNDGSSKLNAIYAQGYSKGGSKQAIKDMEQKVSEISGLTINYGVMINHRGFKDLVAAMGGVEITLDKPFEENAQFNQEHVCDSFFTIPTGKFEDKYRTRRSGIRYISKSYPLCTAPVSELECGGTFKLPAGKQTINGDQALCFARARDNSSDFQRAKRQQILLQQIKAKALSIGTLTDFNKINGIINALGDNIQTDLEGWQIKKFYDIEQDMKSPVVVQRVLENSEEGLLYTPVQTKETGYILLPIGDNYDKIHELFQNTFTAPAQTDISVIQ